MTPLRGTRRADKFVWYVCLFMMGWIVGTWMTPEPRFSACIEIPARKVEYPTTKAEVAKFIKAYHAQGKGVIR
jgi:hypothetical protein